MSNGVNKLLASLASEAGAEERRNGDSVEYVRDGRPFAFIGPDAVELRLMPEIAEAAMRTPSAGPSARGDEWIRFAPPEWDQHATDRLEAWFRVAWRLADQR